MIPFVQSDGGRAAAGFKGTAPGDCGPRAAALVTGRPYRDVYDELFDLQRAFVANSRRKAVTGRDPSPRKGVWAEVMDQFMSRAGGVWVPLSSIGGPVLRVEDAAARWPDRHLVMRLGRHYSALLNGVNHDTWAQVAQKRIYGAWIMEDGGK